MLYKSRGIVLKSIRYKEADFITKIFTLEHGILSFHLRGILKSKRSPLKSAFFLPFSILSIDYNYKTAASLNYLKEVKQDTVLSTIHFEISKNAVVSFLTDILTNILPEKQADENLFLFLEKNIAHLDNLQDLSLFTQTFLVNLTNHLGCSPNKNNVNLPYFDLQEGSFTQINKHKLYTIASPEINLFKDLLGTNFDYNKTNYPKNVRQNLLHQLLKYYQIHVNGYKTPKSLTILEEVFS